MSQQQFAKKLLAWFDKHGRKNLPWQQNINPYRVWISEIMLQQTQVTTVIPYFKRFMEHFPTIESLATASIDHILQLWTGLGYYARARNLHRAAKIIHAQYNNQFPHNLEDLQSLPGIGRSTASAILSITMGKQTPILDGNVKRVFTRLYAIEGWPGSNPVTTELWRIAEAQMPKTRTADYTQAIMDLGATVCTRSKPSCQICPFTKTCLAYKQNQVQEFPYKNPKIKKLPIQQIRLLLFRDNNKAVLLEKRPPSGIWGGLWSFPECKTNINLSDWCRQKFGFVIEHIEEWSIVRHTFSHFHLDILPTQIDIALDNITVRESANQAWHRLTSANVSGGLAAPVKRLLTELKQRTEGFL